jgi:hypothetical protein
MMVLGFWGRFVVHLPGAAGQPGRLEAVLDGKTCGLVDKENKK